MASAPPQDTQRVYGVRTAGIAIPRVPPGYTYLSLGCVERVSNFNSHFGEGVVTTDLLKVEQTPRNPPHKERIFGPHWQVGGLVGGDSESEPQAGEEMTRTRSLGVLGTAVAVFKLGLAAGAGTSRIQTVACAAYTPCPAHCTFPPK